MQSPVLTRKQAVERLKACDREVRALGVIRLALFGSVLRGQTHAQSDVYLLVQFPPGARSHSRFLALSELLEAHLGRPVEPVTTEAARVSPGLGVCSWQRPTRHDHGNPRKN